MLKSWRTNIPNVALDTIQLRCLLQLSLSTEKKQCLSIKTDIMAAFLVCLPPALVYLFAMSIRIKCHDLNKAAKWIQVQNLHFSVSSASCPKLPSRVTKPRNCRNYYTTEDIPFMQLSPRLEQQLRDGKSPYKSLMGSYYFRVRNGELRLTERD